MSVNFCPQCGNKVQEGEKFCSNCGYQLESEQKEYQETIQEKAPSEGEKNFREANNRKISLQNPEPSKMKEQSFLKILLLTSITGGIYMLYYWHCFVRDVNIICEGDGKKSPRYLKVLLLSMVTFGVYGIYWEYQQAQRLYEASDGYGASVTEKGSTILLWRTIGAFLFGLGPVVGLYLINKNRNLLVKRYKIGYRNTSLNKTEQEKMKTLPKVLCICGAGLEFILLAAFIWMIVEVATMPSYDDYTTEDWDRYWETELNSENTDYASASQTEYVATETDPAKQAKGGGKIGAAVKQAEDTQADKSEQSVNYVAAYRGILEDTVAEYGDMGQYCQYSLYDLDGDQIKELITSEGTCTADWQNYVYSINEEGNSYMVGYFSRPVSIYEADTGEGIYTIWGMQGLEEVTQITKEGTDLYEQTLLSKELEAGEAYDELPYAIERAYMTDISLLQEG